MRTKIVPKIKALLPFLAVALLIGLALWRYYLALHVELQFEKEISSVARLENKTKTSRQKNQYWLSANINGQKRLFLSSNSIFNQSLIGDVFYLKGELKKLPRPYKSQSFDYGFYLKTQGFCGLMEVEKIASIERKLSYRQKLLLSKERISHQVDQWPLDSNQKGLYKALFLGDKTDLSSQIKSSFSQAGVIHLLAVSGLHLGIIYIVLLFSTSFFRFFYLGPYLRFIIIVLGLWSFAFFTGAGPSVLRAATMFSLVGFGLLLNRKNSGLRSVMLSAGILVFMNPIIIHQLGFQLSYLAVIGIIYLVPIFNSIWRPKNRLVYYPIQLVYVSIAAQIFTAPLAIYHFHSFPTYFLVANLMVLPIMSVCMYSGILLLVIFQVYPNMNWAIETFGWLLSYLHKTSMYVASWPFASLKLRIETDFLLMLYCCLSFIVLGRRLALRVKVFFSIMMLITLAVFRISQKIYTLYDFP